jgi:hypothetical protein
MPLRAAFCNAHAAIAREPPDDAVVRAHDCSRSRSGAYARTAREALQLGAETARAHGMPRSEQARPSVEGLALRSPVSVRTMLHPRAASTSNDTLV